MEVGKSVKTIAEDYKEIYDLAQKITEEKFANCKKKDLVEKEDFLIERIIDMITMYTARYGKSDILNTEEE